MVSKLCLWQFESSEIFGIYANNSQLLYCIICACNLTEQLSVFLITDRYSTISMLGLVGNLIL